jgi:stalled ribosome rescue protein Dom34
MMGGFNQASYQRHNANMRAGFARETAAELARLVEVEGASHVVLAGDEVAIPLLQEALSPNIAGMVKDVLRLDIRTPLDEVAEEVQQVLAEAEAEASLQTADRLVAAVRADGLGVAGLDETRTALEHGQVDELVLDPSADLDEATRAELVRMASLTSATVDVVEGHEGLSRLGGVGALLRYRHD